MNRILHASTILCLLFSALQSPAAQMNTAKLAADARLDLLAAADVDELRDPRLAKGSGEVSRMNWLPHADQPRSLTVEFAVSPLGWREFELQFTPLKSGPVSLQLRGPWQQDAERRLIRLEVYWDQLQCTGAELHNSSFEEVAGKDDSAQLVGWQAASRVIQATSDAAPAVDGTRLVKTWHDDAVSQRFNVTAGKTVTLRGFARAAVPEGFSKIARNPRRDTPAHRAAQRFLRGVNFGNFLEVAPDQTWALPHSIEDLQLAKKEGFDHVRMPIGWHHYTGPAPEFRLAPTIFDRVDPFVREAARLEMSLLINIHHFNEFTSAPDKERARFVAIWRQLAERYAKEPPTLAFELLNEPKDAATTEVMNGIYEEAIQAIRMHDPERTIFVGPGQFNSPDELFALRLPENDWNLIATVHSYAPMYFTHQGTNWTGEDFATTGIQFPGPPAEPLKIPPGLKPYVVDWLERYNRFPTADNPSSPRAFEEGVLRAQEWSEYVGRPVHFGEFGAYDKADVKSRANYYRAFRQRFDEAKIGWAAWDWKAGFRYWEPAAKRPVAGMREALFGK